MYMPRNLILGKAVIRFSLHTMLISQVGLFFVLDWMWWILSAFMESNKLNKLIT